LAADCGNEAPVLAEAWALLRVARDSDHIDAPTGQLSKSRISLGHLCGEPVPGKLGKRHSFSTWMLCNQTRDVARNIAVRVATAPAFVADPRGAAALCEQLVKIGSAGAPALLLSEEKDESGLSGHVSIRFNQHVIDAGKPEQRRVRDALIAAFGAVVRVDEAHSAKCL
jgi:hypothetical protein